MTGKYRRGEVRTEDSRFAEKNEWTDRHFTGRSFDVLDVVEQIANEKNCTISQLSLAWCTQQPGVTSPIIGPRTMEQVTDNLSAANVQVTDEDRQRIDAVIPPGTEVVSYYNADFGPHRYRW